MFMVCRVLASHLQMMCFWCSFMYFRYILMYFRYIFDVFWIHFCVFWIHFDVLLIQFSVFWIHFNVFWMYDVLLFWISCSFSKVDILEKEFLKWFTNLGLSMLYRLNFWLFSRSESALSIIAVRASGSQIKLSKLFDFIAL